MCMYRCLCRGCPSRCRIAVRSHAAAELGSAALCNIDARNQLVSRATADCVHLLRIRTSYPLHDSPAYQVPRISNRSTFVSIIEAALVPLRGAPCTGRPRSPSRRRMKRPFACVRPTQCTAVVADAEASMYDDGGLHAYPGRQYYDVPPRQP